MCQKKSVLQSFVAGDDSNAKATVSKLIEDIGFAPVDTGSLREGGSKQQPGSPIYNNPMTDKLVHERLTEMAQEKRLNRNKNLQRYLEKVDY